MPADGRCALKRALPAHRKSQPSLDKGLRDLKQRRAIAPVAAGGDRRGPAGQVRERALEGAEDAKAKAQENGLVQRLVAAHKELTSSGISVSKLLLTALVCSSTFGFFIQVSHNNGFLPKYDVLQFKVGPALQSGVIPLVLAPIWLLYGYLQPLLDTMFKDDPATQVATARARSLAYVMLNWGVIVAMFLASDYVYLANFPHWQCSAILAALWLANYKAFDSTRQGLLLALLLLVGAPSGESFIVNVLHLWHYDRPDILGVPHWAGWCYAAYTHGVEPTGEGSSWAPWGALVYTAYVGSAVAYFGVRCVFTLNLGALQWYAYLMLAVELLGAAAVLLGGLAIVRRTPRLPVPRTERWKADLKDAGGGWSIQVLLPCYTETAAMAAAAAESVLAARLPPGCALTLWLLDDGRDPAKAAWVAAANARASASVGYLSERARPECEAEGCAGALNAGLAAAYGEAGAGGRDAVAVLHAHQALAPAFFERALPALAASASTALVTVRQQAANVDAQADLLGACARVWGERLLPGRGAWGAVEGTRSSCLLRAAPLLAVGGFPEALGGDLLLGQRLAQRGLHARHLPEYLVSCEAPEEGSAFRARARRCQACLAHFFSRSCPLFARGLPAGVRLLALGDALHYITAAVCVPAALAVPAAAASTYGVLPLLLTWQWLAAAAPYLALTLAVRLWCSAPAQLPSAFFAALEPLVMWATYLRAAVAAMGRALCLIREPARARPAVHTGAALAAGAADRGSPSSGASSLFSSSEAGSVSDAGAPERVATVRGSAGPSSAGHGPRSIGFGRGRSAAQGSAGTGDSTACSMQSRAVPLGAPRPARRPVVTLAEVHGALAAGRRPGWSMQAWSAAEASAHANAAGRSDQDSSAWARGIGVHVTGARQDLWAPAMALLVSLAACVYCVVQLVGAVRPRPTLGLAAAWAAFNCVPPALLLGYALGGRGAALRWGARAGATAMAAALLAALMLTALLLPPRYDYGKVLGDAYLFYETQRSGVLPADNRIPWRGNSALQDGIGNHSLAGGWYDAGDHLKTSLTTAIATSLLAWGLLEFPEGHRLSGQQHWAESTIRWSANWLMACHISPTEFVAQVGNQTIDHLYWGRPEDITPTTYGARLVYVVDPAHPAADVVGAAAAALAATAQALNATDPLFAVEALRHARELYSFATLHPGTYLASLPEAATIYPSTSQNQGLAWAAAWLHGATGSRQYLADANDYLAATQAFEGEKFRTHVAFWDNLVWSTQLLLWTRTRSPVYQARVRAFLDDWRLGRTVSYTACGLAFRWSPPFWGALRDTANAAHLALVYARHAPAEAPALRCWAASQLRYILGDQGRSLVGGAGRNPPQRFHHRAASCPWPPAPCTWSAESSPDPNPHVLAGAMAGSLLLPADRFSDNRTDFQITEPGVEMNAGFTAALAGLSEAPLNWERCSQIDDWHAESAPLAVAEPEEAVVLANAAGAEVHVWPVGAAIQKLLLPDRFGRLADVVLGFDDPVQYQDQGGLAPVGGEAREAPLFGAVVGRVTGQIRGGRFQVDNRTAWTSKNYHWNTRDGGFVGWGQRAWAVAARLATQDGPAVRLTYASKDGDMGFPGTVQAAVTYTLTADSRLLIDFEATSDAPTPIAMGQHTYFNLDGVAALGTVLDHQLLVNGSSYTPIDDDGNTLGAVVPVAGTPLDFTTPALLGERLASAPRPPSWPAGYDSNLALFGLTNMTARSGVHDCNAHPTPQSAARLWSPASGRALEVLTTAPGLGLYTGNALDGSLVGKGGVRYPQHAGIVLQAQGWPDAANMYWYPQCVLRPNQTYHVRTVWRFYTADGAAEAWGAS
ncbi:hypothetical protein WJX81_006137 [Elliptochloris bilobata]|uniref:cellulase n=1 Tax=Elliptochloris bilobata TaxID=381761 RepID=A0AAW1SHP7_9CHLO